ncbi:uncharacterized protein LOC119079651 [Bradysia coprophila]|uniref:uncharacterized protein LOC119079651 n=1 Tax=Bradysia coprophila TaxID=38358 RepID=UPI00187DB75E|nr:uncharacterized protein LOC119079651 [Bradysia coprophila]
MEVNNEKLSEQSELTEVPNEAPPENLTELVQRAEPLEIQEHPNSDKPRKISERRKKKLLGITKYFVDGKPPKEWAQRYKYYQLPVTEQWSSSRLRQNQSAVRLKSITNEIKKISREQLLLRRAKLQYKAQMENPICFVGVKEEEQNVDTVMERDQVLGLYSRIDENRTSVTLKEEQNDAVKCEFETKTDKSTKLSKKSSTFYVLSDMTRQQIVGIGATTENRSILDRLPCHEMLEDDSSDPSQEKSQPRVTELDILCNLLSIRNGKSNSHQTQLLNRFQRFVTLCTSRPCDYILATVAWHKIMCYNNDDRIDGCCRTSLS